MDGHDGWLIEWFITTLREMSPHTAFLAVAGVLALCGLGLPVPEDIVLITAGFLASPGLAKFPLWVAIALGMGGVLSGDAVLFFLGRRYGEEAFRLRWIARLVSEEQVGKARERVQANARFVCFIARFLPGLRSPIYLMAGAMGIPPRTYISQDLFAASISVPVWVVLGWYFGAEIEQALLVAKDFQRALLGGALVVVVAYLAYKRRQRRQEEPSHESLDR